MVLAQQSLQKNDLILFYNDDFTVMQRPVHFIVYPPRQFLLLLLNLPLSFDRSIGFASAPPVDNTQFPAYQN
jgi:hypothetical protein